MLKQNTEKNKNPDNDFVQKCDAAWTNFRQHVELRRRAEKELEKADKAYRAAWKNFKALTEPQFILTENKRQDEN